MIARSAVVAAGPVFNAANRHLGHPMTLIRDGTERPGDILVVCARCSHTVHRIRFNEAQP